MFSEGSDSELRVWDEERAWTYDSCGLFLTVSPILPIHRDVFSRNAVAQCAESIRQACVDEEHGYRGGILPIAAGVFQVAVSGKPTQLSLGEWEDTMLNATAPEKRASPVQAKLFRANDISKGPDVKTKKWKRRVYI